jgi:hypothetical protein
MRTAAIPALLIVALGATACGSPTEPTSTGLAGTVLRGPTQPVCTVNQPCDAPFSAGFSVQRGTTQTASFRSDPQGHYEVRLSPGTYTIVPDDDAPIMTPKSQVKAVTVGPSGLTMVDLHFDTGIR